MKKFIALILALCSTLTFAACGGNGGGGNSGDVDSGAVYNVDSPNKTRINFHNFNGGVGSVWLTEAAEEFAKMHAETSFGGTKKGVYIDVAKSLSVDVTGLASSGYHILTTDRFNSPNDVANAGELYCLDDVIADTERAGGTLESVIYDSVKPALRVV